ncbi:hypothetical protein SLE2022_057620 [Rubroshorea leprosula]
MPNFEDLPNDCLALIISLTSPLDACRSSLVSKAFNSAAGSDALWVKFLPADYQNLVPASHSFSSLRSLYLSLCDHPVLIEDGKKSFSLDKRSGSPYPIPGFLRLRSFLMSVAYAKGFENRPIDATFRLVGTQVSKRIVYVHVDSGHVAQNGERYQKREEMVGLRYAMGGLFVQGIDIRPCL